MGSTAAARAAVIAAAILVLAMTAAAETVPTPVGMEYQGAWGRGPANGVAVADDLVYFGAGATLQVAKAFPPHALEVIGDVLLRGVIQDIEVIGHHAVVVTTTPGVQVVDISDAMDPHLVASLDVAWSGHAVGIGGDGWIAVAAGHDGLQLVDVTDPRSPTQMGALAGIGEAREVEVRESHAYVAAGEHLRVVDVADPNHPVLISEMETEWAAFDVAFSGGSLVLVDTMPQNVWGDFASNLTMVDVSDPARPAVLSNVRAFWYSWEGVTVVDNWAILTPMTTVYDLTDPTSPRLAAEWWWDLWIDPVPVVSRGFAFEAGVGCGLRSLNVSGLPRVTEIASVPAPWRSNRLGFGNDHAYVLAEDDLLRVMELAPRGEATEVAAITMPGVSLPVAVGPVLFLVKDRESLYTFDIGSSPVPQLMGGIHFELWHGIRTYEIDSGRAYIAASQDGLKIVDVSDPALPTELGSDPEHAYCVAANGDIAVTIGHAPTGTDSLLRVHDVSDPYQPTVLGSIRVRFPYCTSLVLAGPSIAYMAEFQHEQMFAVDLSDPSRPEVVWSTEVPGYRNGVNRVWLEVMDQLDVLVMVVRYNGIRLFDITEPSAPSLVQVVETGWHASDVAVQGSRLAVAEERLLEVFDVSTTGLIRRESTPE